MSRTFTLDDASSADVRDDDTPGGGDDRWQFPSSDGGGAAGGGSENARKGACGPRTVQARGEAGEEPTGECAAARLRGRRWPRDEPRQRRNEGGEVCSEDEKGASAAHRPTRATPNLGVPGHRSTKAAGSSDHLGLAVEDGAPGTSHGDERKAGSSGEDVDDLRSQALSSRCHDGAFRPPPCRRSVRRGRQPNAASASPQARLRRRRGPSTERDPAGRRGEGGFSEDSFVFADASTTETPLTVVVCADSSTRVRAHDSPKPRALLAERRDEVHVGVDPRGERRDEGEPSVVAAAAQGPAGMPTDFDPEDGDLRTRKTRILPCEAAPNAKRRRIRGKQPSKLGGSPSSAAGDGANQLEVQAPCCGGEYDEAAGAFVSRSNSLHDDAAAMGGSWHSHRAEGSGGSPSRLAVDLSTEQCSSCPGHRDGLQPTASCGPIVSSWPARSGRPPDAADAAA